MLTHAELVALHRSLEQKHVLSVYIDGSATDPAAQRSWRLQLDHALGDIERRLGDSSRGERGEFEQCVRLLGTLTTVFNASVGAPGWAAFITSDCVHDAHRLPAPPRTLAVWSDGPCVSPYIRSLKEQRAVVVIITDARHAVLYRYLPGALDRVDTVRAYHTVDHPEHMGTPPRVGFHGGTRGTPGHDAAQRSLLRGRDRMIGDIAERARELAGTDGWILVGGIKRVSARVHEILAPAAPQRVLEIDSLDVHSSHAEIAMVARAGALRLQDAMDAQRIATIADAAGAHGLGAVGPDATLRALEQSCVHDLYFTRRYLEDHPADAERAVRAAFDGDASVEEVSGTAADLLHAHGGMAAGLRFRPVDVASDGDAADGADVEATAAT